MPARRSIAATSHEDPMPYAASITADHVLVAAASVRSGDPAPFAARGIAGPMPSQVDVAARLQRSRARLQAVVRRVPVGAWGERAGDGRWTACEILEHLALTEWSVIEFVRGTLLTLPPSGVLGCVADDGQVLRAATDRGTRMETPERLRPIGRGSRPAALYASVDVARDAALALAGGAGGALRERAAPHPQLGLLDGAQWLLFLAGHTERHAAQLDELAANWEAARVAA
jgi:hypothetical protein